MTVPHEPVQDARVFIFCVLFVDLFHQPVCFYLTKRAPETSMFSIQAYALKKSTGGKNEESCIVHRVSSAD
jgi:hypothetical protein